MLRLQKLYEEKVVPALQAKFAYDSIMQVPRLEKVVVNMGVGDAASDVKRIERGLDEIALITGQKPVATKSKKAVATFKLRENQPIGVKATLRGDRMWAFVDKLFAVALPRVRDFRGTTRNAFDGRGNYTLGVREQIVFPEIDYDKVQKVRGFDVTFVTSAPDDDQARELLARLGLPLGRVAGQTQSVKELMDEQSKAPARSVKRAATRQAEPKKEPAGKKEPAKEEK